MVTPLETPLETPVKTPVLAGPRLETRTHCHAGFDRRSESSAAAQDRNDRAPRSRTTLRGRSGSVTGLRAAAVGSPRALGARRSAHAPLEAASPPRNRPRPRWKAGWAPPCSRGTSTRTARCRSTTSCACEESSGEGNTNVLDGCTQRTCSAAQRYTAQRQDHASAGTSAPSPPANRGS